MNLQVYLWSTKMPSFLSPETAITMAASQLLTILMACLSRLILVTRCGCGIHVCAVGKTSNETQKLLTFQYKLVRRFIQHTIHDVLKRQLHSKLRGYQSDIYIL